MMWVLFALSLIELVVVHFFVALKWPLIGWPLTIVSAIAAIWLVVWIRSFQRLPHRLDDEGLLLRLGNLKSVRVDIADITRIARGWESGATNAKDAINLVGIAYPNRCIELAKPIEKGRRRVFIRLDHPDKFDTALTEAGVTVS